LPVIPTTWIEPPWKMILSNKAILPILWELFPDHPNLLPASREPLEGAWVRKPLLGREGANVTIHAPGIEIDSGGPYADTGFVYQAYAELGEHDGMRPVVGSWMIGRRAAGIGIRETRGYITDNTARFVPHIVRS
jgi:glutathionylspermidine synthase